MAAGLTAESLGGVTLKLSFAVVVVLRLPGPGHVAADEPRFRVRDDLQRFLCYPRNSLQKGSP